MGAASQAVTSQVQRFRTPIRTMVAPKSTSRTASQISAAVWNGSIASGRKATARSGG